MTGSQRFGDADSTTVDVLRWSSIRKAFTGHPRDNFSCGMIATDYGPFELERLYIAESQQGPYGKGQGRRRM